jgi:hypothetical protein
MDWSLTSPRFLTTNSLVGCAGMHRSFGCAPHLAIATLAPRSRFMCVPFAHFKKLIVAAGLVFMTASAFATMTAPNTGGGQQAASVSVDRANKGDRLPYALSSKTHVNNSLLTTTPKGLPLGCDPAFSSLADPKRAHIYKRCTA